jgi:oligopeptide transport system substrate-binding protein
MAHSLRRAGAALVLGAGLLLAAGCTRRESPVASGNREQILYRGIGYEVTDLDPQLATGIAEQSIDSALFEGLVTEDPADLHPVPGVAESWEESPDGVHYVFHLRADARWSDGTPVTAQDFVDSWRRILIPKFAADNANLLYVLQGAEAFNRRVNGDFGQVGVAAVDPLTLRVTLEHPTPYFLNLLTHMAWLPVPLATIAKEGSPYEPGNRWTQPGHIVGNGAFVLQSWRPGREISVVKSPTYWDRAHVRLNGVYFYPLDSVDAEERAFRAGQLHLTDALPAGRVDDYRRTAPQLLRIDPYLATYFYRINVDRPGLNDPRVRRALALAIDRRGIVERILRGGQTAATAFTPPGMGGYVPPPGLRTDFAAARDLLALAGYPGGKGLPAFTLLYNNSENHRVIAEAVQETWRRELGVEVQLLNQEAKAMIAARGTGDYQIVRSSWVADYADPSSFLDVWRTGNGNNYTGWTSADYDSLLFAAARTPDAASRNALWQKAESLMLAAAPIIPIYYYTHVFLLQPSVHGWYPNPLDHHPYKAVWLEP